MLQQLSSYMGLAGVSPQENEKALLMGRLFGMIIIAAVLILALQWHLELKGRLSEEASFILNLTVWLFFLVETIVITKLVNDKKHYLINNWMNLFIITIGSIMLLSEYEPLVSLLRSFRIIIAISLFIPSLTYILRFLTDSRLSTTVIASLVIVIVSGVLITSIDPGIKSIEDGLWWAVVTVTTVGYGDVVPHSNMGRVFSALLILIGLGLFSVLTANFAALFMQEQVDKVRQEQEEENKRLTELHKNIDHVIHDEDEIISILRDIQKRLEHLEQNKSS